MVMIRGFVLLLGILCFMVGWSIDGMYFTITACYPPLWRRSEEATMINEERPMFLVRFLARIIDYMIVSIVIGVLLVFLEVAVSPEQALFLENISFVYLFIYFFLSFFMFRKTIGDKILKIELTTNREDGRLTFLQAFTRTFFAPIGALQGLFFLFTNKRCLMHDRISGTDMVKTRKLNQSPKVA